MAGYICLISKNIGGAERRFLDIHKSLVQGNEDVRLLLSARLYGFLNISDGELSEKIIPIGHKKDSFLLFVVKLIVWILKNTSSKDSFHYPLSCLFFLHLFSRRNVSVSVTDCYNAPHMKSFRRSEIRQHLTFFFVRRIDVLNPSVYSALRHYYFINRKLSLTPSGTYVFPVEIKAITKEKIKIGFMGRLVPGKGVDKFFHMINHVWDEFSRELGDKLEFFVAGYGPLESYVIAEIATCKKKNVPVTFFGKASPFDVFSDTLIVVSMQDITNYPSRVVAEALMSGCYVLVRDTGDSRNFGSEGAGLFYLDQNVTVHSVCQVFRHVLDEWEKNNFCTKHIIDAAKNKYSNPEVVGYFSNMLKY